MLTATCLICLLSSGRSQIMCNASLIFNLNRELSLSMTLKQDPSQEDLQISFLFKCRNMLEE